MKFIKFDKPHLPPAFCHPLSPKKINWLDFTRKQTSDQQETRGRTSIAVKGLWMLLIFFRFNNHYTKSLWEKFFVTNCSQEFDTNCSKVCHCISALWNVLQYYAHQFSYGLVSMERPFVLGSWAIDLWGAQAIVRKVFSYKLLLYQEYILYIHTYYFHFSTRRPRANHLFGFLILRQLLATKLTANHCAFTSVQASASQRTCKMHSSRKSLMVLRIVHHW